MQGQLDLSFGQVQLEPHLSTFLTPTEDCKDGCMWIET